MFNSTFMGNKRSTLNKWLVALAALCCFTTTGWSQTESCLTDYSLNSSHEIDAIAPGDEVTLEFTVTGWNQVASTWMNTVFVTMGEGWESATYSAPASCDGTGAWDWYGEGETAFAAGFFYDRDLNGDPTDDFGDSCSPGAFIVTLTAGDNAEEANLWVGFNTAGDNETGAWASGGDACNEDAEVVFGTAVDCEPSLAISCPENVEVNCSDDLSPEFTGMVVVETSDCTEEALVSYEDVQISEDGECPIVLNRTFLVEAGDLAELCTQMITLIDTEGPEFVDFEETITVECLEDVPAPGVYEAVDACSGLSFDSEIFESNTGEITDECELFTAFGPGDDWSLWLPTFEFGTNGNYVFDENGGAFEQYEDGTARLYGTVVNEENENEIFVLDLWFDNKSDWETWSSMGRSYKDDLNCATPDALYEDWTYYTMVDGFSTAIGAGDLEGAELYFYHMPANYYFGFQIGEGANNKNCDYGLSGWFTYEGMVDGMPVSGHGDVNVDATCEPNNEQDCPHNTEFTYLYRAVDNCGNATVAEQTIVVNDTTGPEFIDFPADITVDCDEYPVEIPTLEAVDNCVGDVEISGPFITETPGECANEMTVEVAWSAVDICDNQTNMIWTITVVDNDAPVAPEAPADLDLNCAEEVPAAPALTAIDNCSGEITVDATEEMIEGECAHQFTLIRTWTFVDDCDNTSSVSQTINVYDEIAPEFTFVAEDMTLECDQEIPAPAAEATDNCEGEVTIEVSAEIIDGDCPQEYTMIRTYVATDVCGNSASATQTITVVDTTAPVFDAYEYYISLPCEEVDAYTLTATDNCGEVTVEVEDLEILSGGCLGVLHRLYTATDECGNSTEAEQFITIQDFTAPELFDVPADMTVECDEVPGSDDGTLFGSGDVYATDNCEGEVELTYSEEVIEGECENAYTVIRTWVAMDYCENVTTASQTVTVEDNTNPWFENMPADATVECSDELPAVVYPDAYDNCDDEVEVEMTTETEAGDCPQAYTLLRIFRGFDNCGNEVMAVQTITVVDTTAPEFTFIPEDATYECDEDIALEMAEASDNCGAVTVTYVDGEMIEGECPEAYSFVRTFTAEDECGNSASVSQNIYVEDTTAPVIDGEAFLEMPCDMISDEIFVTATDNCDAEVEITFSDNNVSGGCAGNVIRTYTATDNCGNSSEFTQVINLYDEVAPEFSAFPVDMTVPCTDVPGVSEMVDADDNCDDEVEIAYLGEQFIAGDCAGNYTLIRTWSATDNCDNVTEQSQTITVVDEVAPEFTAVPADATYECDMEIPAINAEAEDNCGTVEVTWNDVITDGECANAYSITRTFTATDDCGNSASATQIITVVDTTAPEFTFVPAGDTFECDQDVDYGMATAEDNCGDVEITFADEMIEGDCPQAYSIVRTWTATDACGNATSASSTYYVEDTTAPVITADPELDMPCDEVSMNIFASATDNCDTDVEITYEDLNVSGGCAGNILRTYTATDDCGNSSEFTQIIHLIDEVAPELFGVPADATVECGDEIPAPAEVGAEDNCDDTLEVMFSETTEDNGCLYNIIRTWTVVDHCDNMASATQIITIVDTTAPELWIAEDVTVECDEEIPAAAWEAYDACDQDLDESINEVTVAGDCANAYSIERTYTVTDDCGNSTSLTQIITVVDTTAPEFTFVPAGDTFECDQDVDYGMASAEDNCGDVEITFADEMIEGDCPQAYSIVRTWTATDACGNAATASTTYYVEDTTAPVITAEAELDMPCDQIDMSIFASATDNCDTDVEITYSDLNVSGGCAGNILRTYVATDDCGNSSEYTQIIHLIDEVAPELFGVPADATIECGNEIPAPAQVGAEDNCDDELEVMFSEEIVENDCLYSIIRTWTVVDHCDNMASASQTITIVDTTAPELWVAEDVTVECDEEIPAAAWEAYDVCDEDLDENVSEEVIDGACPQAYSIVRTYTVTDNCGNSTSLTQTITVEDTTAPEFTFVPQGNEFECDEEIEYGSAAATDNCGEVTITFADEVVAGECANNYTIIRTWTAMDECGNSASAESFYYVYDATAPTFDSEVEDVNVECASEVPATPELTATDNCGDATVSVEMIVLEEDECGNGVTEVIYTAMDACGNTATTSYLITVNDVTAPVLSEMPEDLTIDCEAEVPAPADITASDNCDDVEVLYSEEIIGDLPAEGSDSDCLGYTGESPYYETDWSLWLQNFPGGDEYYVTDNASFVTYPDGTATISGEVTSTSTLGGWSIDVTLVDGMDWTGWSSQEFPTGYKDDFGVAGENYLDWTYYIVQAGSATLTGIGIYEGMTLELSHAPANYYYAFQVGIGANNTTANYGGGGWFYYDGVIDGMEVSGAGDFSFDLDCCPRYEILRTWTAMDCSGNLVSHSQIISFGDLSGEEGVTEDDTQDNWSDVGVERENPAQHHIFPNPTAVKSMVEFVNERNGHTLIEVYSLNGTKVADVFNQNTEAGITYRAEINAANLADGIYLVRIQRGGEVTTDRLIISK